VTRFGWSDGSGRVTSVVDEELDYLEIEINRGIRGVRKSEGRWLTPDRGWGIPAAHRNRWISAAVAATSGGRFHPIWRRFREGKKEREKRGSRGFIGEVLMAITCENSTGYYSGDRFH
jgi:hypothetical protein